MAHTDNVWAFYDLASNSTDQSGGGNSGTDTSVTYDGTKATFDGSSSRIIVPTGQSSFTDKCTIAAWVECSAAGSFPMIFSQCNQGGGGDGNEGCELRLFASDGTPNYNSDNVNNGRPQITSGGSSIVSAGLIHLVGTYSGTSGNQILYQNGSSVASQSGLSGNIEFGSSSGNHWAIGDRSATGFKFTGTIRSLAIYIDEKDSTWVTADYNSGTPKKWADWNASGFIASPFPIISAAFARGGF